MKIQYISTDMIFYIEDKIKNSVEEAEYEKDIIYFSGYDLATRSM